jgi:hypothetical protein
MVYESHRESLNETWRRPLDNMAFGGVPPIPIIDGQLQIGELLFVRRKRLENSLIRQAGQPNATPANVTLPGANRDDGQTRAARPQKHLISQLPIGVLLFVPSETDHSKD